MTTTMPTAHTEYTTVYCCNVCGGSKSRPSAKKRGFRLRRCGECDHVFVAPPPSQDALARMFSGSASYFVTANTDLSATSPTAANELHELLARHDIRSGRLLDIGSATGQLLFHLRELGWNTSGVEVNADAAAVGLRWGVDVRVGTLDEAGFPEDAFDVVHLGSMVQHLPAPYDTFVEIRRILRPGGLIVLSTPNAGTGFAVATSVIARVFNADWPQSEAPYNLSEFTARSLSVLLERSGFNVVSLESRTVRPFLYTVGATGYFDELKADMKGTGRYQLTAMFIRSLPKLVLVAATLLPFHLAGVLYDTCRRQGGGLFAVARRPQVG